MDASKEYIVMCEKAVELQEPWKPTEGDRYCYQDMMCGNPIYIVSGRNLKNIHNTDFMKNSHCPMCYYDYNSFQGIMASTKSGADDVVVGRFIWLPRQDQLERMIRGYNLRDLVFEFMEFTRVDRTYVPVAGRTFFSMEQLWLAFVMKERYGKVWKDEGWEKIN